jgi:hypothetical protein
MNLYHLARVNSATAGTGTLTLGAAVAGCLTFAQAGVPDGATVGYAIHDGSSTEVGRGTYTSAGTTLSRDTVLASTNSGNKINCSGSEQVSVVMTNKDMTRYVEIECFAPTQSVSVGDGAKYFHIPPELNGMNLIYVHAMVVTAGATGTMSVQIHNLTDASDMLSTKLTIDTEETGSNTAVAAAVIDTTKDDVATNDVLRIDIDAIHTAPAKGLVVTLGFGA